MIIGFTVFSIILFIVGVFIGCCCQYRKKKSKFISEVSHEVHENRTKDIKKSPEYEEVLELNNQENMTLNKNKAYEQVSA